MGIAADALTIALSEAVYMESSLFEVNESVGCV